MGNRNIAESILSALGGQDNIRACGMCATRLKIIVRDMSHADLDMLSGIRGVLGIAERDRNGLEVVLGPRLTASVSDHLSEITGIHSSVKELMALGAHHAQSGISIQVNEPKVPAASDDAGGADLRDALQDDGIEDEALGEMLVSLENGDGQTLPRSLLVINGPNINMLGIREPDIYGNDTYAGLVELCRAAAEEAGFDSCACVQSNHEGDLIDSIQQAFGVHDAIVINPAAYTHTSIALLDALKAVQIPAVEVHISDVDAREGFRQASYVREACIATIAGHGIEGYREAVELLADHLGI